MEQWTNVSTGELHEYTRDAGRQAPYTFGRFHQISDRRALSMMLKESGLTHSDFVVFLFFGLAEKEAEAGVFDDDDAAFVDMSVAEVADLLGMSKESTGRIVRKLRKKDLLFVARKAGRTMYYRATPHVIFRGSGAEQREQASRYRLPQVEGMFDREKMRRVK